MSHCTEQITGGHDSILIIVIIVDYSLVCPAVRLKGNEKICYITKKRQMKIPDVA